MYCFVRCFVLLDVLRLGVTFIMRVDVLIWYAFSMVLTLHCFVMGVLNLKQRKIINLHISVHFLVCWHVN